MCGLGNVVQSIFTPITDLMFGKQKEAPAVPAAVAPPAPVDTSKENDAALARRAEEERKAKQRKGMASTIVTNPLGITDAATVEKSNLLGVAK